MEKSYLLINTNDYFSLKNKVIYGDKYQFIESVLKYLERHDIPHLHCFDTVRVYVWDLFSAKQVSQYFGLADIRYFENGKIVSLFKKTKKINRADRKVYVKDFWVSIRKFESISKNKSKSEGTKKTEKQLIIEPKFEGNFVSLQPKLWLFGAIEWAIQGSFIG